MSPYRLECTTCPSGFSTRKDWLQHLYEEKHQRLAREECHQWFKDDTIKECVVIAFATFPLASSSILSHLSKGTTIVTDFVWWAHRPKLGLLQFESSLKVDELLKNGSLITVDSQQVHLRRMSEIHPFEWNELIPNPKDGVLVETTNSNTTKATVANVNVPMKQSSSPDPIPPPFVVKMDSQSSTTQQTIPLEKQFAYIMKEVEISPNEVQIASEIKAKSHQLCTEKYGRKTHCRATLFRNWYLGYKNSGMNELLIFVECRRHLSSSLFHQSSFMLNRNCCKKLLHHKSAQYIFSNLKLDKIQNSPHDSSGIPCEYTINQQTIKFNLITNPGNGPEVYSCDLLKYLCLFDPRVKPLIYLVSYWARVNNIRLSKGGGKRQKGISVFPFPEPALLEWLVAFFCCVKGIIPSPRHLKNRPHESVLLNGVDIGFGFDFALMDQMTSAKPSPRSSELALHVCELAQEFFEFCSELGSEPCILNMRDGEVIKEEDFRTKFTSPSPTCDKNKLTNEEVASCLAKLKYSSPITVISPLVDTHTVYFNIDTFKNYTCKVMKNTATKLTKFCENPSTGSPGNNLKSALFYDNDENNCG